MDPVSQALALFDFVRKMGMAEGWTVALLILLWAGIVAMKLVARPRRRTVRKVKRRK